MFKLNCSVLELISLKFHYSRPVKIASRIKYSTIILVGDFCLSSLALKILRNFHGIQLFEQIMFSCLIGSLVLGFAIWIYSVMKSIHSKLREFVFWMLLVSTLLMMYLGPNTVMNIDRSRSFYVLSWVGHGDIQINHDQLILSKVVSAEKLNVAGIQERINEQIDRGLIERKSATYLLTYKGKVTLSIANRLATFYQLEGWFNNRN